MKTALIILLVLHGAIHIMGFVKAFNILPVKQLKLPISKSLGTLWLATTLLCFTCAALVLVNSSAWWIVSLAAALLSQILVIRFWKDAKFGTVANSIIAGIIVWFGIFH